MGMSSSAFNEDGLFPARQEAAFTPEEENELKARLFTLLSRQVRLRTQGDHSSLREEDAAELLRSLVFSLRFQMDRSGLPLRALLTADLRETLAQAQQALRACLEETGALYETALQSVDTFASRFLADTLSGLAPFFRRYDVTLYAHLIPASIDYPLCLPVPDALQGVLWVKDYLERLMMENALVKRFAPSRVTGLLDRASPDYRDLLFNLYEPVAANAVGLSLLGGGETELTITPGQAAEIHRMLAPLPPSDARERLAGAARAACERLSLSDDKAVSYLSRAARALYPRIAVSPQSAAGVFSACRGTV